MAEIRIGVALHVLLATPEFTSTKTSFEWCLGIFCSWMAGSHNRSTGNQARVVSRIMSKDQTIRYSNLYENV